MLVCTERQLQVCVSLDRVVFASPSTPEGITVLLYLALKGTAGTSVASAVCPYNSSTP